jgi:hypothetical protein
MEINILGSQLINSLIEPSNRYIVTKVCDRLIIFPDTLVAEILIVERSSILPLPFYDAAIIGVVHHQASVMPLLMLKSLLQGERSLIAESLTIIKLSQAANQLGEVSNNLSLGGTGLIVDRVIGSMAIAEYANATAIASNGISSNGEEANHSFRQSQDNLKDGLKDGLRNGTNNIELNDTLASKKGDGSKDPLTIFNKTVANIGDNEYTPIEIVLLNTPNHIWQPQRWQSRGHSLLDGK